ncbi:hypothetical protein [Nocardia callitridis]|uniref:Uncharacterized protein n=1 Tax=Nocardia callitridis TaxID=648753 RepID=A0ABP9KPZ0_9NOCA
MSQTSRAVPLEKRVNLLFATVIDGSGAEVTVATVAAALAESLDRMVPIEDIEALRRPSSVRPSANLLAALASYFDMPESFLSDDPAEYYSPFLQLSLLVLQRDKRIPFVALRPSADSLGDSAVQELTKYLESLG